MNCQKKDVTFLNSVSFGYTIEVWVFLEHFGIGILVMVGLSTTRIKKRAIHFESNHLNDSTVEFVSSLIIAEHLRYKNHLFFTLSSCTLNKTRQNPPASSMLLKQQLGRRRLLVIDMLHAASCISRAKDTWRLPYVVTTPRRTPRSWKVSIIHGFSPSLFPIATLNTTSTIISIIKEKDSGTLVIPDMYLDKKNTFCQQ